MSLVQEEAVLKSLMFTMLLNQSSEQAESSKDPIVKESNSSSSPPVSHLFFRKLLDSVPNSASSVIRSFHTFSFMDKMKHFPKTANATSVQEPANPTFSINKPRAPTIPAKDVDFVPIEHNLDKQFDIPPFVATKEKYLFDCRKALRHDAVGKPLTRRIPLDKGCVNAAFKRKHSLSKTSRPQDFAEAFLPFKDDRKVKNHMSFQLLTRWTNLKASLASAGNLTYTDYRDFSERELRQHFGQYVLHGISPTPQVEYQFRSQTQDPVPGIDFCYTSFGPNAERWHKHFKAIL